MLVTDFQTFTYYVFSKLSGLCWNQILEVIQLIVNPGQIKNWQDSVERDCTTYGILVVITFCMFVV